MISQQGTPLSESKAVEGEERIPSAGIVWRKLEFLALKWAVTAKFSDCLYGADFTVVTDSNH